MRKFVPQKRHRDSLHVQFHQPYVARVRRDRQRGVPHAGAVTASLVRNHRPRRCPLIQLISVVGALAILAAYTANQFRWIGPSNLLYTLLNLVGAGVLSAVAIVERQ